MSGVGTVEEMHIGHTRGRGEFGRLHSYGLKDASQGVKRERAGVCADANRCKPNSLALSGSTGG